MVNGVFEKRKYGDQIDLNVTDMQLLDNVRGSLVHNILISLSDEQFEQMHFLKEHLADKGGCGLYFRVNDSNTRRHVTLASKRRINVDKALIDALQAEDITFKVNANI